MRIPELGEVQERFARIVWAHAPVSSGELVKLCEKELNWKKPTTYTVLRKLCEKGLFENKGGVVRTIVSYEEYCAERGNRVVDESFAGSLPAFVAAFASGRGLKPEEAEEIAGIIEAYRKEQGS